ncbi:MAG TPA: DUF1684 domain-containing protein [Lacunisphaera sp.]
MLTRLLLLFCLLFTTTVFADDYVQSVEAWRAGRIERLQRPDGWLTLIGRHPLAEGTWSVGSAEDSAIRLAAGPARFGTVTHAPGGKVTITLADGVDATIDGTTARTAELVYQGDKPTYVRAGTVNFYVMDRSGKLFLRVRDNAAARLKNFAGIDAWPVDPAWRVEATWVPFDPPREVRITNIIGLVEPALIPGKAVFTHEGRTHELIPIDEGPDEDLFFVLTDTTAGTETYEACRFLYAPRPKDGKIILDFNKVYNPPCAFTPFATCPLPPRENVLPFALRAGEKKYRGDAH